MTGKISPQQLVWLLCSWDDIFPFTLLFIECSGYECPKERQRILQGMQGTTFHHLERKGLKVQIRTVLKKENLAWCPWENKEQLYSSILYALISLPMKRDWPCLPIITEGIYGINVIFGLSETEFYQLSFSKLRSQAVNETWKLSDQYKPNKTNDYWLDLKKTEKNNFYKKKEDTEVL